MSCAVAAHQDFVNSIELRKSAVLTRTSYWQEYQWNQAKERVIP
jgi:hypothetical protein